MEFISENYIWLIVVGVFIIMIVVGYFADKKQNAPKKEKLKDHVDELDNQEDIETNDVEINEWEDKPIPKEEDEVIEVKGMDNSFDSWDTNLEALDKDNSNEETKEEAPVEETTEEVQEEQPTEEATEKVEEPKFDNLEEEDIKASEEPVAEEENKEEQPVPEVEATEEQEIPEEEPSQIEDLEITLPNIDTLNEEIKDVVDAEDVWKF